MKPCLHPSITTKNDLVEYLDLAQEAGFEWVDVDMSWLETFVHQNGERALEALFESRKLSLASFGLPVDVYADESTFALQLARLPDVAALAMRLGATRCCTWLWPSIDERPVPYASRLARRFRQCAVALMPFGVRLGLEYVGPHHLRNKAYPFVQNVAELKQFLEAVGAPNTGVLFDSIHWYTAEESEDDLREIQSSQIVHVHLNDTMDSPKDAHDLRRTMPGTGQIPLQLFLRGLYQAGYRGPISVEVLHEKPLAGTDVERVAQAFATMNQLIEQAKEGVHSDV